MTFDLDSKALRDREYSKFVPLDAGSQTVVSVNLNNNVKVYEFPVGSIAALNTGDISGGNFHSYTDYPLNGLLYGIQVINGNTTAAGSLDFRSSGAGETVVWSTITRATSADFTVYPRGEAVTSVDLALSGTNAVDTKIPLSGIYQIIGSDVGKAKGFSGLRIIYI